MQGTLSPGQNIALSGFRRHENRGKLTQATYCRWTAMVHAQSQNIRETMRHQYVCPRNTNNERTDVSRVKKTFTMEEAGG